MGKPFIPTDELREAVAVMRCCGVRQATIAKVIGVAENTLTKHFEHELDEGLEIANSRMARSLYENGLKGNVIAQLFWMKTRAGWKEYAPVQVLEHVAGPFRGEDFDVKRLSDSELHLLMAGQLNEFVKGREQGSPEVIDAKQIESSDSE